MQVFFSQNAKKINFFSIILGTKNSAVLLEMKFITNLEQAKLLSDAGNLGMIADGVFGAICGYQNPARDKSDSL